MKPLTQLKKSYFYGNVCIDDVAVDAFAVKALQEKLNSKCAKSIDTCVDDQSNWTIESIPSVVY